MSENQLMELLKSTMSRFEEKLDSINKELQDYKQNFQISLLNLQNKVDIHETKLQTVDKFFNKSLKDKIVDKIIDGTILGFSGCVGIFAFIMIFKAMGSNIFTILKPIISAVFGV